MSEPPFHDPNDPLPEDPQQMLAAISREAWAGFLFLFNYGLVWFGIGWFAQVVRMTRFPFLCGLVLGLLIAWSMACSPMLPKTGWQVSDAEVARLRGELGQDLTAEQVRDPAIDVKAELTVPCLRMLEICWAGMPWYWKALGSVPLGCTQFWLQVWRDQTTGRIVDVDKTALSFTCVLSPQFVKDHEREHLDGMLHQ